MRVIFTGAGGTGKTTMAEYVSDRYAVRLIESSSRTVQKEFGLEKEDDQLMLSTVELTALQNAITDRYWSSIEGVESYVSDRTILDHFTYRVMKGWNLITEDELAEYEAMIEEQFTFAHLVVYAPTGLFDPPADNFRTESVVQRDLFDRLIVGTIDRLRNRINLLQMGIADPKAREQHLHSALLNVGVVAPEEREEQLIVQ